METFGSQIKSLAKSDHATAGLYAAMIGLVVSDIVPTPADGIYFRLERGLRDKWTAGQITPQQYWARTAAAYYLLNPAWWGLVLWATVATKGSVSRKFSTAAVIIGAGGVIAVLLRNVNKDIAEGKGKH